MKKCRRFGPIRVMPYQFKRQEFIYVVIVPTQKELMKRWGKTPLRSKLLAFFRRTARIPKHTDCGPRYFGTVYIWEKSLCITTIVHELSHVAHHAVSRLVNHDWVETHSPEYQGYYYHEMNAYTMDNLVCRVLKALESSEFGIPHIVVRPSERSKTRKS